MKATHLLLRIVLFAAAMTMATALCAQVPAEQGTASRNVWDGVYSQEQAGRGRTAYNISCSSCHRPDLSGFEGVLRGEKFMDRWREDSLDSLFSMIKRSMPRNDPGSLASDTYADIVAYILQQNEFPSGTTELKPEALKDIQVTGKNGAEPLPAGALVQTYGCVQQDPENNWVISKATNATRTRNPDKSSDADLKLAEAKTPGKRTFRLVDAAFYHPERYKDRLVEAKGFLVPDPTEGLSVTSLAPLSVSCP